MVEVAFTVLIFLMKSDYNWQVYQNTPHKTDFHGCTNITIRLTRRPVRKGLQKWGFKTKKEAQLDSVKIETEIAEGTAVSQDKTTT